MDYRNQYFFGRHPVKFCALTVAVLLLQSCGSDKKPDENNDVKSDTAVHEESTTLIDTVVDQETGPVCDCTPLKKVEDRWNHIQFSHWDLEKNRAEYDSLFRMYAHDSVRLKIKSLGFSGFDEIPAEFKVFKNVERLVITGLANRKQKPGFKGPELFPQLNSIDFWGCYVILDSSAAWLKKLERLYLGKTTLAGISSFRQIPNLKSLQIGHSGFKHTPQDINKLTCLQELNIEEYKFSDNAFPVREIDLSQFPCLRSLRFWGGTMGLPQKIDSISQVEITVRPWQLSEEEKKKYEAYQQRFKQKKH